MTARVLAACEAGRARLIDLPLNSAPAQAGPNLTVNLAVAAAQKETLTMRNRCLSLAFTEILMALTVGGLVMGAGPLLAAEIVVGQVGPMSGRRPAKAAPMPPACNCISAP